MGFEIRWLCDVMLSWVVLGRLQKMVPVATGDIVLRMMVERALKPETAAVAGELLRFEGSEFRFKHWSLSLPSLLPPPFFVRKKWKTKARSSFFSANSCSLCVIQFWFWKQLINSFDVTWVDWFIDWKGQARAGWENIWRDCVSFWGCNCVWNAHIETNTQWQLHTHQPTSWYCLSGNVRFPTYIWSVFSVWGMDGWGFRV